MKLLIFSIALFLSFDFYGQSINQVVKAFDDNLEFKKIVALNGYILQKKSDSEIVYLNDEGDYLGYAKKDNCLSLTHMTPLEAIFFTFKMWIDINNGVFVSEEYERNQLEAKTYLVGEKYITIGKIFLKSKGWQYSVTVSQCW